MNRLAWERHLLRQQEIRQNAEKARLRRVVSGFDKRAARQRQWMWFHRKLVKWLHNRQRRYNEIPEPRGCAPSFPQADHQ